MIAFEPALMYRLVVSDPVSEEVESLDPIVDVTADNSRISRTRMPRKGSSQGGDPERGQVRPGAEEPPEAEPELCDHPAVDVWRTFAIGAGAGGGDVLECPTAVPAREQLSPPVPDGRPSLTRAVIQQHRVQRIAEDDLQPPDVLVEGGADRRVPVVESDRTNEVPARRGEVRTKPIRRQTGGDHGVVNR